MAPLSFKQSLRYLKESLNERGLWGLWGIPPTSVNLAQSVDKPTNFPLIQRPNFTNNFMDKPYSLQMYVTQMRSTTLIPTKFDSYNYVSRPTGTYKQLGCIGPNWINKLLVNNCRPNNVQH